jgi:hypothetical protein
MKFLTSLLIFFSIVSFSQENEKEDYFIDNHLRYKDYIYQDSIKSAKIFRTGWELSQPFINLNSQDQITLLFDDIGHDVRDFSYKIIHCTSDWKPSDLMPMDYLSGQTYDMVSDYKFSFNTIVSYTNYQITIPNDDLQFTISGNYLLVVYENNNEDNLVLTARFSVFEKLTDITGSITKANQIELRKSNQQVNFVVNLGQLKVNDAYQEIKPVILQNGFWNTAVSDITPNFLRDRDLVYDFNDKLSFQGGNEFRNFDVKDLKYQSQFIKEIVFENPFYHIKLYDDIERRFKLYFSEHDINGNYLIKTNYRENSNTEGDYVHVYFTLPYDAPIVDGDLYIFGRLTNGTFLKENRMIYNYAKKAYQLRLMLKQGYYNYEYIYLSDKEKQADISYIEGSHWETENDYTILIYFHGFTSRYDRLVGLETFNTINK